MAYPLPKPRSFRQAFELVPADNCQHYFDTFVGYCGSAHEAFVVYMASQNNRFGFFNEGAD